MFLTFLKETVALEERKKKVAWEDRDQEITWVLGEEEEDAM